MGMETCTQHEQPEKGEMKCSGISPDLLLTQPAIPTEQDCSTAYGTDLQEQPQTLVELDEIINGDALPS